MDRPIEIQENLDRLYCFICNHKKKNQGNTPTVIQMRDGINESSTSTIHRWLGWLADDGRITRTGRSIYIPGAEWTLTTEGK